MDFKNTLKECFQIFDTYTDVMLAVKVFHKINDPNNQNEENLIKCNISFVLISLSIFCPYLIQFSTRINMLYHRGMFKKDNLRRITKVKHVCLLLQISFIGVIFIPFIHIMLILQTVLKIITLPLACFKKNGMPLNQKVSVRVQYWIKLLTEMNEYSI